MKINLLTPDSWALLSENAHKIAFGEIKPASMDRIDGALIAEDAFGIPMGYLTFRESDSETVYWQFGGAMPGTKDTIKSFKAYQGFVKFFEEQTKHKRITTLIENTNTVMLKMAMKVGFRIVGIRNYKGSVLLEHLLEFGGA
jgi:hypothetical protein